MIVVCNATPLILLAKLSEFQLLKSLYSRIYIPKEVYNEVVTEGKDKPGEKELRKAQEDWIEVRTVSNPNKVKELKSLHGLEEGEAAAIILVQELKANFLLTDDKMARKFAFNLFQNTITRVSGTIGILKFAREEGLISKAQLKSKIESLKQEGFYLEKNLYQQILREIDQNSKLFLK